MASTCNGLGVSAYSRGAAERSASLVGGQALPWKEAIRGPLALVVSFVFPNNVAVPSDDYDDCGGIQQAHRMVRGAKWRRVVRRARWSALDTFPQVDSVQIFCVGYPSSWVLQPAPPNRG